MAARRRSGPRPTLAKIRDGARRQPLPLHRLRGDLPRGPAAAAMRTRRSSPTLRAAREPPLAAATRSRMLRDDGPLTPLAGCTDLYVALNFGTLQSTPVPRSLAARRAARHRAARTTCSRIGALATYTDAHRARALVRRAPADAGERGARGRRRADPESRHARRQHRQRLAGRRHAAGARRRGGGGRAAERGWRAARAVRRSSTPATGRRPRGRTS